MENVSLLKNYYKQISTENYSVKLITPLEYVAIVKNNGSVISIDSLDYINQYCEDIYQSSFSSMLILGLGIGIMPYHFQNNVDVIDVIEIEQEVIDICKELGHLKDNVNIILDDATTLNIDKKYDIVIVDYLYRELSDEEINSIVAKYNNNLNDNGFIYIPINRSLGTDKMIIQ